LGYFEQVRDLTADIQRTIFLEFGLPPPPGGVALLRRLTTRHEREGDRRVLELGLQCRLLLGVEGGIAITDMLEVPFVRQSEPDNCVQACMKMALQWCLPVRDYSFQRLDELSGRNPGSWTWPSQAAVALAAEGLDVRLFSDAPLEGILDGGAAFLRELFGPPSAAAVLARTDLPSLQRSLAVLLHGGDDGAISCDPKGPLLVRRRLTREELHEAFLLDELILLPIDYSRVSHFSCEAEGQSGSYNGHLVVVTGWGHKHIQVHDPLGIPNKILDLEALMDAWGAPGADNDAILIRRSAETT